LCHQHIDDKSNLWVDTAKYVIYVQEKEEMWNSKLFLVSERRLHFFNYILTGP